MFIWVCFLDPVEIPQPLGILGEFGLGWALPKTKSMNSLTLCPALFIQCRRPFLRRAVKTCESILFIL